VVDLLEKSDRDSETRDRILSHSKWLAARVHSFSDGRNTERVYQQILARLDGTPAEASTDIRPALSASSVDIRDDVRPHLVVTGSWTDRRPVSAQLAGTRVQLPGTLVVEGATWTATVALIASRNGGPALPPPSGRYRLRVMDEDRRVLDVAAASASTPTRLVGNHFRVSRAKLDDVVIDIAPPLADDEVGASNQKRLQAAYRASKRIEPDAIFFESYYGQNASSNPRGIDRALVAARPGISRIWSVVDGSVEVPDGSTAVVEGSAAWWQARASSRVLIVNDWLRKRYRKRRGQTVLQTWHGTPLKKIALDRAGTALRTAIASRRESSRWGIMLAQNPFSADVFRSAYAFRGPVWLEGYPRDDILVTGDGEAVRQRLGIAPSARVVLYAPTWRDDRPGKVDHLDVASFGKALGPGFVTLIRGHSRTLRPGADVVAEGVIDVTSYPDISDLFLIADALVTDYSSVMFDFTVTGKPIYFFTPDLVHYRDELRGFYFDLLAEAPGPVLTDPAQLVSAIREPDADQFAERYAAWKAKFNPRDDGQAGDRVVRRLIAEGLLD